MALKTAAWAMVSPGSRSKISRMSAIAFYIAVVVDGLVLGEGESEVPVGVVGCGNSDDAGLFLPGAAKGLDVAENLAPDVDGSAHGQVPR
jgi:hypothetical protein